MPRTILAPALAALLALAAVPAMASGFGRMSNATVLGQPLDMSVALQLDPGQTLTPDCIGAEVYAGEFRVAPSAVHVTLMAGRAENERLLRVATQSAIDEPVVSVTLQVGCTSPMTRKYVAFVDPPMIVPARAGATALASAAPAQPQSASAEPAAGDRSAPAAAAAAPSDAPAAAKADAPAARRSTKSGRSGAKQASARAPAKPTKVAAAKPRRKAAAPRAVAAAPDAAPGAKGPRLQLDAASPDVLLAQTGVRIADALPAVLPATAAVAAQAAASAAAAASAEIDAQRERLAALEASLAKLRAESQATQASLVTLQTQLRESQAQRYANPLVYSLLVLCVLLGTAAALLWRARATARGALPQWWAPQAAAAAQGVEATPAAPTAAPATAGPRAVHPDDWEAPDTGSGETTASPRLIEAETQPEVDKEMSVEELIDLEQQAEFFVVLGQDEAAIDLLMGHLRSSGGTSPLPYLKLLEIYRRRDDRDAYERTRDRFNRRFNAYAPEWDADLQRGRSIEDYAQVVARLQSLWASPGLAMRALETALFRRDPAASNFDLPAYRELLFLYSVARDLSEHRAETSVDVLLPIGAGDPDASQATLTPLHPTRPVPIAVDAYTTQVDVDITSLDAGASDGGAPASRYLSDFGTTSGDVHVPAERFAASR